LRSRAKAVEHAAEHDINVLVGVARRAALIGGTIQPLIAGVLQRVIQLDHVLRL